MTRIHHSCARLLLVAMLCLPGSMAQEPSARLSRRDAAQLYERIGDLMEASSIAAPELARAGAPLMENVRRSAEALQAGSTREHAGILYKLLLNARIFMEVADAVPKPNPFAEDVQRQLSELRDSINRAEIHFRALLEAREAERRNPDRDNLQRYAEANRSLGPPSPREKRAVFLGDSITDGWALNQYFPGKPYVNRGISGQITGQMLGRMKADVVDLEPAVVVILAGTNDIGRGVSSRTIKDNLTMIADLALGHGIQPVFASILPVSDYHKAQDPNYERTPLRPPAVIFELNQWLQQICKSRGLVYLDYHAAMVDGDGQLQASMADDGLHPNAEGYRVMAPLAEAAIAQALQAAASPPARKNRRFGIF